MNVSQLVQNNSDDKKELEQFAADVLSGLSGEPKALSAKYFYDDTGSKLFQAISQHEDYYPTRTEFAILDSYSEQLPKLLGEDEIDIIELGAGDGHKSTLIINSFLEAGVKVNFHAIDISEKAMAMLGETIKDKPNLSVHGFIGNYFDGLKFVKERSSKRQLVLFLGSSIGNFDRNESKAFLRRLWNSLNVEDYVLIGFDLKKNVNMLLRAYNDSSDYTRDLNLNLLTRINRELGGDFDRSAFQHYAMYNPHLGAMESYLLSLKQQNVFIEALQREFYFDAFEPLHLEYSFKFLPSDIDSLCRQTGYTLIENFSDKLECFTDSLWQVTMRNN